MVNRKKLYRFWKEEKWRVRRPMGRRRALGTLLRRHGVSTVVNCTVKLDVNYVAGLDEGDANGGPNFVVSVRNRAVPGLQAGAGGRRKPRGNDARRVLHPARALHQTLPGKQTYPRRERGKVLVHCRGGRRRSVAWVTRCLHLQDPIRRPELGSAIAVVREKRELHPDEWVKAPKRNSSMPR